MDQDTNVVLGKLQLCFGFSEVLRLGVDFIKNVRSVLVERVQSADFVLELLDLFLVLAWFRWRLVLLQLLDVLV